ncbi:hypothetical protein [Cellulomonas biazotea]|uniref:KfrA N-terminal DNA-binding domain-containing protein n=1 Tax=Cellulomonas biazotea TaxID=1709 RepID=A0A402DPE9_9CELL|nr:hypothetical protein [Cellulomonas biazotea]GCE76007.1 hypothetical protein CBZ_10630 [Cellulomonas biazotea]
MNDLDELDLGVLTSTPTRLRATAAALALVVGGKRPSVSEVARLAGVSRQALNKDHKPVTEFVAQLRERWQPAPDSDQARLTADLDQARRALSKERDKRKKAEAERDRALHHLQLAEASLAAERERLRRREVISLPRPQLATPSS